MKLRISTPKIKSFFILKSNIPRINLKMSESDSDDGLLAAAMIIASSYSKKRRQVKPKAKRRWWSITLFKKREQ